jgi:hypothetical protein
MIVKFGVEFSVFCWENYLIILRIQTHRYISLFMDECTSHQEYYDAIND